MSTAKSSRARSAWPFLDGIVMSLVSAGLGACNKGPGASQAELAQRPRADTVQAVRPDSMDPSGCSLVWKSVLGDSTVQVATLDLKAVRVSEAVARPAMVQQHIQAPRPGYALILSIPTGALHVELRMALETRFDSVATEAVIIADADRALVIAYVDTINAALRACRARTL